MRVLRSTGLRWPPPLSGGGWWAWALWCLALLSGCAGCPTGQAGACAEPRSPPFATLDQAVRLDGDKPEPVTLPDTVHVGTADWLRRHYRLEFMAPQTPAALALYLPGARANLRVSLNGAVLLDGLGEGTGPALRPRVAGMDRHRLIEVPASLWRPGRNTIDVEAVGRGLISVSPVLVGELRELQRLRDWRVLVQVDLPAASSLVIGSLAAIVLVLWMRQRHEPLYGWFGIGAMLWSLHTAWSLSRVPALPAPHFGVWWTSLFLGFVAPMVAFCVRLSGWDIPRFTRFTVGCALAGPAVLYLALAFGVYAEVEQLWRAGCLVVTAVGVTAVARYAWFRRDTTGALLLLVGVGSFGFGTHDWLEARAGADNNPVQLTPFGGALMALLMAWVLIDRFVNSAQNLERLNRELEMRVADRNRTLMLTLEETHAAKEEAERAVRSKSRFLAHASHDLRQPLQALSLYLSSLGGALSLGMQRDLLDRAERSLEALRSKFNRILELPYGQRPELALFDVEALMRRLANDCAPLAFDKDLRFALRTSAAASEWSGHSDPILVERIVQNLIANAVKFTSEGGVILRARLMQWSQPTWRIEVWDSGCGISAHDQQHVFEEYYQAEGSLRGRQQGQGLGLAIASQTAAALGLQLALTSRLGQGTRFSLDLPAVHAAPAPTPTLSFDSSLDGLRVALFEDDDEVREAMTARLQAWGCIVLAAPSTAELLTQLAQPADVVIADYRLSDAPGPGGFTGIDVVLALRAAWGPELPALIVSGESSAGIDEASLVDDIDWLMKPVQVAKLRSWLVRKGQTGRTGRTEQQGRQRPQGRFESRPGSES